MGVILCRNPFQGGMGFFLGRKDFWRQLDELSQSLSGWDGVFHNKKADWFRVVVILRRNPFQGGMGFFTILHGGWGRAGVG